MDKKEIVDVIKLKAKCKLIDRKLYDTGLFCDCSELEIHVDSACFDEIADALGVKTICYDPTWYYSSKDYGKEYFNVVLHKKKFTIFSLWKKGNYGV